MAEMIRNLSRGLWDQYPIGTRLDSAFLSRRRNQVWSAIFNAFMLFWSLFANGANIWPVLVTPFLGRGIHDALHKHIPPGSRAIQNTYLAITYPIGYLLGAFAVLLALTLLVTSVIVLPIIAVVFLGVWALCVVAVFLLWLALYRYPAFEVIYPRLRQWQLRNNAKAYSSLPTDLPSIRILRLKPGAEDEEIECALVDGPLSQMEFEALSYVWGVSLLLYTIIVNGKPFYVTYNLHSALKELRYADHERLLWVDAVCINQGDNTEKSSQVQMMRDIYAKASITVVWLGKATRNTGPTFDFVRAFGTAHDSMMDTLWKNQIAQSTWQELRDEFIRIFDYEWWSRAWIIQEVVVSREVVMQRGSHQVEWEAVHKLFTYSPFGNDEFGVFEPPLFAKNIQFLRTERDDVEGSSTTLGDLVSRFRFQSATFGSDKIYALLGLLKAENPSLIVPDYNNPPDEVFLQFTRSYLHHNKDLNILSLAAGTELQSASWCRDWSLNHDGSFETFGLLTLEPRKPFAASGTHGPLFEADLERRILSHKGYEADTVARIGTFQQRMGPQGVDWDLAFRSWELVAGDYLDDEATSYSRQSFSRTVTADCWQTEPLDWRERFKPRRMFQRNDEDKDYKRAVEDPCINRRFFVTQNGRFGLGPWNMKKGDIVSILLGGKTPFILRRCGNRAATNNGTQLLKPCHKLIGEAFVDGLMYYDGSMEDDVASAKIATTWFHLS